MFNSVAGFSGGVSCSSEVLVGRTLLPSFPSAFVSRSAVVYFFLVWIQFELGQFGILVNSFVDSLG